MHFAKHGWLVSLRSGDAGEDQPYPSQASDKALGRYRCYPITNAFRRAGIAELDRLQPTPPSG